MSQKVPILNAKLAGHPYLGVRGGNRVWGSDPAEVVRWLCDAWRFRFNSCRGNRIAGQDTPTEAQQRAEHEFLAAAPSRILVTASHDERTEWVAGMRRIKNQPTGTRPARAPGFKSLKRSGYRFHSVHGNGAQVRFQRISRKRGMVIIGGQNPLALRYRDEPLAWSLRLIVRIHQDIRPYTSVHVDWSAGTLTFVGMPAPIARQRTGRSVGLDRGVVNTVSTSEGEHLHIPRPSAAEEVRLRAVQAELSRLRHRFPPGTTSRRYLRLRRRYVRMHEVQRRRRQNWLHQTTTALVRRYDLIAVEDLRVRSMMSAGRHRTGLNREIGRSSWSLFSTLLSYKASLAGVEIVRINPRNTSRRCSSCSHVAPESRESQAVFRCVNCDHTQHADTNAAINILDAVPLSRRGSPQDGELGSARVAADDPVLIRQPHY